MRVEKPNSAVHENECFYIVMLAPCKSTTTRNSHFTFRFSSLKFGTKGTKSKLLLFISQILKKFELTLILHGEEKVQTVRMFVMFVYFQYLGTRTEIVQSWPSANHGLKFNPLF